jgi:enoyl-CoA hydratase
MSAFKTITYEKEGNIAWVTLNRPKHLNAFSVGMRDDLFEILQAIRDDDEVNVGIVKGAGAKAFCAGADLSEFLSAPPPVAARRVRRQRDVWELFLSLPQPIIAAVHGYVLGSGIEMALCCDIRLSSDNARFGLPEVALGILPAAGGTQTLPRLIGRSKALELLLTNEWVDAQKAHDVGLVNRIVSYATLDENALQLAEKIAAYDPAAVRSAKQAVTQGLDLTLAQGVELERRLALQLKAKRIT